ncbi:MAG TPA: CehA/McbA family metallohydrolase [Bryobacterales bacterium]|nr:CehA/McbA family metallohydrolase [Bryobacterales bacterium]
MKHLAGPLTAALVVLLGAVFALRDQFHNTHAADSETVTWGATDPAWSPDGSHLAFSLFGSIWSAPAEGGEAQQVSASPGYHAHPAWSPKGDTIAFVRGNAPAGPVPKIPGALLLVDVASGREREIRTPHPVSGTLAWSPDGTKLACALRVNDSAASLYEITAADGSLRAIQQLPQPIRTVDASTWVGVAWNPKRPEIFFSGQRGSAPEIWSIAPAGVRSTIQMPLTRYRAEDIVNLNSLSALPDGSGVIYSADVVNGKGNYELYRVGRYSDKPPAEPVNITNTIRDEFSPAVSPDGRRIAVASNHLGNIDLFTMPVAGGEKKHVRLTGLKFRDPSGRLRVRVTDELGQRTPVRLYVSASDGKAYCPAGSPIFYYPLDPGAGRQGFFVASGDDTFPVPAGRVQLAALKGVEYDIADRVVEVGAGETAEISIQMHRWTNWNQLGWYTGENHFHANYGGSYYQRPAQSLAWLEAEDLNAANMIVANNEGAFIHDKEFFSGAVDPLSTARYVLYWGQEYRNSYPLGHMAFLNIKRQVPPSFTSVPGSNSPYDFPLNTMAALEAKRQGGFVSYVHPIGGQIRDVFDTWLGAKESPVGAALGAVDSFDILPYGEAAYELWYRFLNCGFRIPPGAGTDVFTNWRGIDQIPGGSREYVEVGSAMSWDRWLARYREGRDFATNGPLLTFTVNGEPMGAEIRVPPGQTYRARLVAEVTSRSPLEVVEFIQNGNVIESRPAGRQELRLEKEVPVDASCWFAVRARGRPARGVAGAGNIPMAHSGPIYVTVGSRPVLLRDDLGLMIRWIDRLQALLEERHNFGPGDNRDRALQMIVQARRHYQAKLAEAR